MIIFFYFSTSGTRATTQSRRPSNAGTNPNGKDEYPVAFLIPLYHGRRECTLPPHPHLHLCRPYASTGHRAISSSVAAAAAHPPKQSNCKYQSSIMHMAAGRWWWWWCYWVPIHQDVLELQLELSE